jgi:enterochelin esterase family protein
MRILRLLPWFAMVLAGQPSGPVAPGGPSARIDALKQQAARGNVGAVGALWARLGREHTPLVEEIPGDGRRALLTMVWRGGAGTSAVRVLGVEMARIPQTDVWYATFQVSRDQRIAYVFQTEPGGRQPDPLNPHRVLPPVTQERPASAVNGDSPYMNASIAAMPGAPGSPWVDPQPGVAAGRVEEYDLPSKVLGRARRIWVYEPPRAQAPAAMLICLWGRDYLNEIPVPTILDNLIGQRKVAPMMAIFIADDGDRFQNFERTGKMAEFVTAEVIPWAQSQKKAPLSASKIVIAGYSASGLAATYAAYKHPEAIGNVLAQSGAFWRGFEGEGAPEVEWLSAHFASAPRSQTKFFLHAGGKETRPAGGSGVSILDANRKLRGVLRERGYRVAFEEVPGGEHEFLHWRSRFGDGLIYLLGQ